MMPRLLIVGMVCLVLSTATCAPKKGPTIPPPAPPAQPAAAPPTAPEQEAAHVFGAQEFGMCGVHCGTERWRVKTLSGTGAANVDFTSQSATIRSLTDEKPPQSLSDTHRETQVEQRAVRIKALLIGYKREPDGDLHIVLADLNDPEITLIAEIPDADKCSFACSSQHADEFRAARKAFLDGIKDHQATKCFRSMQEDGVPITMTGVPMFDRLHGQTGVAENGIELHPVLTVDWGSGAVHAASCANN
jgi:hypothetical protein